MGSAVPLVDAPIFAWAQIDVFPEKSRESRAPRRLVLGIPISTWSLSPATTNRSNRTGRQVANSQKMTSKLLVLLVVLPCLRVCCCYCYRRLTRHCQPSTHGRSEGSSRAACLQDAIRCTSCGAARPRPPPVDDYDLTPEYVASPGDIESIMCSWADYMMTNPPRNSRNPEKLLKADGVGNGYGLVKEYLKDNVGQQEGNEGNMKSCAHILQADYFRDIILGERQSAVFPFTSSYVDV